jgi:hypothetical protein
MASRMQSMMQTHCSEALTLLNNTGQSPQKSFQVSQRLSILFNIILEISTRGHEYEKGYRFTRIKNVVAFIRRQFPGKQQC